MSEQFAVTLKAGRGIAAVVEGELPAIVEWLKKQADVTKYEVYSPVSQSYSTATEFLQENIDQFVPKFYKLDPDTEDLLPSGSHLANGMVVLIGSPERRDRPEHNDSDWMNDRIQERNRWCTVTNLEFSRQDLRHQISFVGVYEDGSKRKRTYHVSDSWIVKITSIADSLGLALKTLKRRDEIEQLVEQAIYAAKFGDESRTHDEISSETTTKILGLL